MKNLQQNTSPVFAHLKAPSLVDFPGRVAAVMFTAGCNFQCGFCHNTALMGKRRPGLSWEKIEQTCQSFRNQWADGAVISGGEPTLWGDSLKQLITLCKQHGLAVKLDTNGSRPGVLREIIPLLDYVAMDVKCRMPDYAAFAGFSDTSAVAESIAIIKSSDVEHEFRTTLIESFHTDEHLTDIAHLIRGARRYVLQPFIPRADLRDERLRNTSRTSPDRLRSAQVLMRDCAEEVVARGS